MSLFRHVICVLSLALAACGSPQVEHDGEPLDPLMAEALQGQLMVDPDLSQQNFKNLAIDPGGPRDPALPLPDPALPSASR